MLIIIVHVVVFRNCHPQVFFFLRKDRHGKEIRVLNNVARNQRTNGNFSKYATVRVKLRTHMLIRMSASDV